MCYLVAKKFNAHGCIAVQSEYGAQLASLVDYLGRRMDKTDVQILTVSSMETFSEYAPYNVMPSEEIFISKVLTMA